MWRDEPCTVAPVNNDIPEYLRPFDAVAEGERVEMEMANLPDTDENLDRVLHAQQLRPPVLPEAPQVEPGYHPLPPVPDAVPISGGAGRRARGLMIPKGPSDRERAEHELTHWPFRSWCGHCAQSRGHAGAHQQASDERVEQGLPQVQMDFYFMRTVFEDNSTLSVVHRAEVGSSMQQHVANKRTRRLHC